ncbi:MAG TPA: phosphatidate cytidylyltransferase [Gammaproteobacteria bacterium]|nr:phosphatidate cytidylyltransferase [Gammaproteobacteria bacterium]
MLKARVLTAIVLIPFVIAGIFFFPDFFPWIAGFVTLVAAKEWDNLLEFSWLEQGAFLTFILSMLFLFAEIELQTLMPYSLGFWIIMAGLVLGYKPGFGGKTSKPAGTFLGTFLLIPFWISFLWFSEQPSWFILSFFLLVWTADTAAYFGGKKFGKTKLLPHVSPNKTWEGFFCGAVAVGILGNILFFSGVLEGGPSLAQSYGGWIFLLFCIFLASVVGDLFESLVKRIQGAKDSGGLLPGHGGVLDRIDSLLAATPIVVFLCGSS